MRVDLDITGRLAAGELIPADTFNRGEWASVLVHVADQEGHSISGALVSFSVRKPTGAITCNLRGMTAADGNVVGSCRILPNAIPGFWDAHVDSVRKRGYFLLNAYSVLDHYFLLR